MWSVHCDTRTCSRICFAFPNCQQRGFLPRLQDRWEPEHAPTREAPTSPQINWTAVNPKINTFGLSGISIGRNAVAIQMS